MTTKEKFIDMLFQRCLSLSVATQIVERAIPIVDRINGGYKMTWDRDEKEYPSAIYSTIYEMVVKKLALKWINKTVPNAFYKSLFV